MQDVIARLRAGKKDDEGFTLIELLVVVVIIGVLVAIAVPVYLNYRQGAADKSAQSDVRGAISAIEQWYTSNGNTYPTGPLTNDATGNKMTLPAGSGGATGSVTLSDKTVIHYASTANSGVYKVCANNTGGTTGKYYLYDSNAGGSVKETTAITTANFATCG